MHNYHIQKTFNTKVAFKAKFVSHAYNNHISKTTHSCDTLSYNISFANTHNSYIGIMAFQNQSFEHIAHIAINTVYHIC